MNNRNTPPRESRDSILRGTIEEISADRVRVRVGDLLSDWLQWGNSRAGKVKISSKPSIGEGCIILSTQGNIRNGTVIAGINTSDNPMPEDCGLDDLVIDIPESGRLLIRCGSSSILMTADGIKFEATRINLN